MPWSSAHSARAAEMNSGPSTDPGAEMCPVITKSAQECIEGMVAQGEKASARVVVDGRGFRLQSYEKGCWGGTLLDRMTPDMTVYREEIFAPVLSDIAGKQL